ncbi:MAG: hypothetical protein IPH38_08575 [Candidatus Microthrix sp.]|nr:hypothetical protein [Candidatus Microthrix sp.]MBK7019633.1 hypothetical protein [Candidatus Microthrix sp.]
MIAGVAVGLVIAVGLLRGDAAADAILGGVADLLLRPSRKGSPAVVTVTLALGSAAWPSAMRS